MVISRLRRPGIVDRMVPALWSTWDRGGGGSTDAVIVALGMGKLVVACGRIDDRGESHRQVEAEISPSA